MQDQPPTSRGTLPTPQTSPDASSPAPTSPANKKQDKNPDAHLPWYIRWYKQIRSLAILLLVMFAFRSTVYDWNDIPSGSMLPTVLVGDRVFVNRAAFGLRIPFTTIHLAYWSEPKRGDIVVFYSPDQDIRMIKRVIGVPGDTVTLVNNQLIVNGTPATYAPLNSNQFKDLPLSERSIRDFYTENILGISHPVMFNPSANTPPEIPSHRNIKNIVIPKDNFLMIGDNRDFSQDSRFWGRQKDPTLPFAGFVPRTLIVGKAWRVAFSLDADNYYLPRWNRFFAPVN